MKQKTLRFAISPTKEENYADWYLEVIKKADLAEYSNVRGCMVIKPWGYAIWENIRQILDEKFRKTGHENAYFPLFVPLSDLEKEAEHVDGFAKECAVVTHHRLQKNEKGQLVPAGKLEEPLIVRPTSEMIIGQMYAKWVKSYRDLPILWNQWANVVRWEMRTRLFLRTTEFLWQEGHTVHETEKEAIEETKTMLQIYVDLCRDFLAIPTIPGKKSFEERFPGAVETYTLEAMMQDRKALQAGTSHFLGQNFAKSCGIQFQNRHESLEYGWTTSWGVTTRLIGAVIMTHSDNNGLVLPPKIAPKHIVILPVIPNRDKEPEVLEYCKKLVVALEKVHFSGQPLRIYLDKRDMRGGEKMWSWVKKGTPIRIEIGPKECTENIVCFSKRTDPVKQKTQMSFSAFSETVGAILSQIQDTLLANAQNFLEENTQSIDDLDSLYQFFSTTCSQGFAKCYYHPSVSAKQLQEDLAVTVRCIPLDQENPQGSCILSGKTTTTRAIFAKAY